MLFLLALTLYALGARQMWDCMEEDDDKEGSARWIIAVVWPVVVVIGLVDEYLVKLK